MNFYNKMLNFQYLLCLIAVEAKKYRFLSASYTQKVFLDKNIRKTFLYRTLFLDRKTSMQ